MLRAHRGFRAAAGLSVVLHVVLLFAQVAPSHLAVTRVSNGGAAQQKPAAPSGTRSQMYVRWVAGGLQTAGPEASGDKPHTERVVTLEPPIASSRFNEGGNSGGPSERLDRDDEETYYPRSALTVAAKPIGEVKVRFPDDVPGDIDITFDLTVFVDYSGRVKKVKVERPDVHPQIALAAVESFRELLFEPAHIDSQTVNSRFRVEIHYRAKAIGTL